MHALFKADDRNRTEFCTYEQVKSV